MGQHYDEIAGQYPVFKQLKQVAKLVVVAEWIDRFRLPMDYELLYLRVEDPGFKTPKETPPLSVKETDQQGNVRREVTATGGIQLESSSLFAADANQASIVVFTGSYSQKPAGDPRWRPAPSLSTRIPLRITLSG